jgi:opacity protein-like surface antigen
MIRLLVSLSFAFVLWAAPASAQTRFDVGLLLGSTATSDEGGVLQFDRGRTFQATVAWRVWHNDSVRVALELPFVATPDFSVATSGRALPKAYASLYLTPGVRVTVLADRVVSIFGAAGAGYARYSESTLRVDGSPNPAQRDTNTNAFQFGGGVDVRALRWLGFRAELRDLCTGTRTFSISTPGERVHNVVASGGLVLRF